MTLLSSGNLLLTYGRRIRPMGCGALISTNEGRSWDYENEILLAGDGIIDGDLGYPSTVQLKNGNNITAIYYASGSSQSEHFGTSWGSVSCQVIHYREIDILKRI